MGKPIAVASVRVVGQAAVFDTDRSITGQDGAGFSASAGAADTFAGRLAGRLFAAVSGVDHVYAGSAQVVVRRPSGWDEASLAAARDAITGFFVVYR